jgi:hypothetical protein
VPFFFLIKDKNQIRSAATVAEKLKIHERATRKIVENSRKIWKIIKNTKKYQKKFKKMQKNA